MTGTDIHLNHRERATLLAVAEGRAEMSCSSVPDLFIDGIGCCDQFTAHRLARFGLLRPQRGGSPVDRVPALLTEPARTLLGLAAPVSAT